MKTNGIVVGNNSTVAFYGSRKEKSTCPSNQEKANLSQRPDEFLKQKGMSKTTKIVIGVGTLAAAALGIFALLKGKKVKILPQHITPPSPTSPRPIANTEEKLKNIVTNYIKENGVKGLKQDANGNYYNFERILNGKTVRGIKDPKTGRIIGKVSITDSKISKDTIVTVRRNINNCKVRETYTNGKLTSNMKTLYDRETGIQRTITDAFGKDGRKTHYVELRSKKDPGVKVCLTTSYSNGGSEGILIPETCRSYSIEMPRQRRVFSGSDISGLYSTENSANVKGYDIYDTLDRIRDNISRELYDAILSYK